YYAYYELGEHAVPQHFGVRTQMHKLFYLPETNEWQMFDLVNDPQEMTNIYGQPSAKAVQAKLHARYDALRKQYDAPTYEAYAPRK
ncbi:MAG: sulfatase/phosphatase domain-containing protein, partial [Fuerstiella sp.]